MRTNVNATFLVPLALLIVALIVSPVSQLDALSKMPGDIGDARLNNYFLENVFQFLIGNTESLWHLPFFYPFPYALGFSENLFGSSPVYVALRIFNLDSETAFQIWFIFGYAANFAAGYYAFRRLNGSVLAATVGALIFAFALPTTAHAGHPQLHYRCGIPLAIVFLADFLKLKKWRYLLIAGLWCVWQFYASVYMGFFTLLLMGTMISTHLVFTLIFYKITIKRFYQKVLSNWLKQSKKQKVTFILGVFVLFLMLVVLFYPYLQVSYLYGAKRSWSEISSMLPRPQSYFLADASALWSRPEAAIFSGLPMRHEHQMFIGLIPLGLAFFGFLLGNHNKNGPDYTLMCGMLGTTFILTLHVGGFSLWYLLHKLPLASAIRGMTRIDQALLFPVAYLAAITIDEIRIRFNWGSKAICVLILPLLIFEAGMSTMYTSSKDSWRQRSLKLKTALPGDISADTILFFSQRQGPPVADELDVMWLSLMHQKKTMNGYSGSHPPEYSHQFDSDCAQVPRRILAYLNFTDQAEDMVVYRQLMSRVRPVGFINCDSAWLLTPPALSNSYRSYTKEEFRKLRVDSGRIFTKGDHSFIRVIINNSANHAFAARSAVGQPIRLSWRFMDLSGQPLTGWDTRKDMPFDIPSQGTLELLIDIGTTKMSNISAVQVSLVQESVFWAHDIGMQPLLISLR